MSKKLRVSVLMGGKSIEHEVSFNSGRTICDHLDTAHYIVTPIFQTTLGKLYILPWHFLHRGKISDFEHRLKDEAQEINWDSLKEITDFVYIALHGRYAEDGTVQAILELLSIPYLGSKVRASALGMHKIIQKKILSAHNISVTRGIEIFLEDINKYIKNPQNLKSLLKQNNLIFPLITKPAFEGSSFGISVVRSFEDLIEAISKAHNIDKRKTQPVLIEEYITGMEFSCIVIVDKNTKELLPLPPTEIVIETGSGYFDYQQKYMPGKAHKFTPARCSPEIIQKIHNTCLKVMHALEMKTIGRIDGFIKQDTQEVVIIDPNTLTGASPSTFPFRQAAEINMSHTQFINHLIETELINYGLKSEEILKDEKDSQISKVEQKIRVGVLLGGRSAEKEISLESGRNIFYKLSPHKYSTKALFLDNKLQLYMLNQSLLVRNNTSEIVEGLKPELKIKWSELPKMFDFVFIALHGGEGENGVIQGTLETLGIPYNGSGVLSSAICIDKYKTNEFLRHSNFNLPKNIFLALKNYKENKEQIIKQIQEELNFPIIIKPHNDGCSVFVSKALNSDELNLALENLSLAGREYALIEEYIIGMELTVGVIGNNSVYALPPSHTRSANAILSIEEKFLPGAGENQTPAPLAKEKLLLVQDTVVKAYKELDCKGYARIDCFYQNADQSPTKTDRIVIIEVNTLPGMTPATCIFHQAAEVNIRPMDFIDLIVKLGLEEHSDKHSLNNFTVKLEDYNKLKDLNK